jgi:hypothetical protein
MGTMGERDEGTSLLSSMGLCCGDYGFMLLVLAIVKCSPNLQQ